MHLKWTSPLVMVIVINVLGVTAHFLGSIKKDKQRHLLVYKTIHADVFSARSSSGSAGQSEVACLSADLHFMFNAISFRTLQGLTVFIVFKRKGMFDIV